MSRTGMRLLSNEQIDLFVAAHMDDAALERAWSQSSADAQAMARGYVAGYNRYLADNAGSLPVACKGQPWVQPMTLAQMRRLNEMTSVQAGIGALADAMLAAQPPATKAASSTQALPSAEEVAAAAREIGLVDPPLGSNAWAFGKDTTGSGRGLLLTRRRRAGEPEVADRVDLALGPGDRRAAPGPGLDRHPRLRAAGRQQRQRARRRQLAGVCQRHQGAGAARRPPQPGCALGQHDCRRPPRQRHVHRCQRGARSGRSYRSTPKTWRGSGWERSCGWWSNRNPQPVRSDSLSLPGRGLDWLPLPLRERVGVRVNAGTTTYGLGASAPSLAVRMPACIPASFSELAACGSKPSLLPLPSPLKGEGAMPLTGSATAAKRGCGLPSAGGWKTAPSCCWACC